MATVVCLFLVFVLLIGWTRLYPTLALRYGPLHQSITWTSCCFPFMNFMYHPSNEATKRFLFAEGSNSIEQIAFETFSCSAQVIADISLSGGRGFE